jgi:NADPH:quinone reductase-like Zn-dependent oxidoreductase
MKAAQINTYGHADVITINEVETPTPKANQVLVEVYASSINPIETMVREGYVKETMPVVFPATLGGDIAGVIMAVGGDVTSFVVGDKVYGQASILAGNSGAFAEYATTSAGQVGSMPVSTSFSQAASLPLVGVSAVQALTQHIDLQAGQKLFIHGGAGGIGSIALQIAKHIGAYVATTATGDGVSVATQLGADEVIDYKQQDFTEILKDYDAVYDTVGGEDFTKALAILKPGGVAVSMTAHADAAVAAERDITAITQLTHVTTEMLGHLAGLVDQGIVTPQIGATYSLDQIRQAFEARESGEVPGKVVIEVRA